MLDGLITQILDLLGIEYIAAYDFLLPVVVVCSFIVIFEILFYIIKIFFNFLGFSK